MKVNRKHLYIIFLILCFPLFSANAQNECEVPLPPELTSVTVLPETSTTLLNWALSPSSGIAAYIVYIYETRLGNPGFFAIDTIWDPSGTTYSDTRIQFKSFQYRIAAFRAPKCASELSNILSTIFTETRIDTCKKKINITWNKYTPPSPQIVTKYTILMSVNGGSFTETGSVPPDNNSFLLNEFTINADYCFKVIANLNGGSVSSSYKACLKTKMQKPPDWINADYATVKKQDEISLSFTIDPFSEIDTFALERKSGYSGSFRQIAQINGTNIKSVTYTDNTSKTDVLNYYRLSAVICKNNEVTSNNASNIVLDSHDNGNEIILQWNKYHDWIGSISSYRLFTDVGKGFIETATIYPPDTSFIVNIPDIMFSLVQGRVCFYISASETGNIHGITGESASDTSCISIEENVTVPNIFSPDGDGLNDLFRPVISFAPSSYQLLITDRQRKTIFETRDYNVSWDGSAGGSSVSQGVYLWFLKLTAPSGKKIIRTGTVTVIKTR
jgi:gliding motility-associated-like protein